mmetsp:Transcript_5294/g.7705  ORF Transcript_5294/g.7705 Transcript_5294/m.7705 type:complete len:407 (-) Transcript_5294:63-1283(-)
MPDNGASQAPFVLYSCAAAIFGLLQALAGPALPDLEQQSQTDSAGIGAMFVYRGIGSMIGGFTCGFILDAVRNPHHVLVVLLLVKACVEFAIPCSYSLTLLALDFGILQFCANSITTVSGTCVSWTYGKLIGLQMNIMNGMFGVGTALAPLLASALRFAGLHAVYGYWVILALDLTIAAAAVAIPAAVNPRFAAKSNSLLNAAEVETPKEAPKVLWLEVIQCCLSLVCAGTGEGALQVWLHRYATKQLGLSDGVTAIVNTSFFIAFTCTRFLCGLLVGSVGPAAILVASTALGLVAPLAMMLPGVGTVIPCVAMVAIGIGVAGLYPNSVAKLGQRTFISGRAQGFMRVSAALGTMLGSSGPGFLWPLIGSFSVPAIALGAMVAEVLLLLSWLPKKDLEHNSATPKR